MANQSKAKHGKVRVITGEKVQVLTDASLTPVQSSITCNGGLPRPQPS